jgi:ParB family chromosome partitioning protein
MEPKRVLIVEPDSAFALSLAALYREDGCVTRLAASAAETELEIATRRPDLVVARAELPDLSGFSLCARLRHDPSTARLPVILYSSDTPPESLAEHARTPWAANGYLAMPLDTAALRLLSGRILAAAEPVESADDAVLDETEVEEVRPEGAPPAEAAARRRAATCSRRPRDASSSCARTSSGARRRSPGSPRSGRSASARSPPSGSGCTSATSRCRG